MKTPAMKASIPLVSPARGRREPRQPLANRLARQRNRHPLRLNRRSWSGDGRIGGRRSEMDRPAMCNGRVGKLQLGEEVHHADGVLGRKPSVNFGQPHTSRLNDLLRLSGYDAHCRDGDRGYRGDRGSEYPPLGAEACHDTLRQPRRFGKTQRVSHERFPVHDCGQAF
jgi:hypothetical protein